jgi:signal transduction histidine kinase
MEKEQVIILVIFFTALSLLVAVFLLAVFLIQRAKTNKFLLEKELRQQQYETQLLKTQMEVQEETRKNIGIELHDNIGQLLSLTNMTIASVRLIEQDRAEQKLADSRELIRRAIGELRQLSKVMHGELLLKEGLESAIRNEITWLQRNDLFSIHFFSRDELFAKRNEEKDLFIFRLVQECLNNIIKHAEATIIEIYLQYETESLIIEVADNGKGFEVPESQNNSGGLGLHNMQKRILLLIGKMEIASAIGQGTKISFTVPYP